MKITKEQKDALWNGVYGNQDWQWVLRPVTPFSSTFVVRRALGPEFMWVDFVDLENGEVEAILTARPLANDEGREWWEQVYEFEGPILTVAGMEKMFNMFLTAIDSEYKYSDAYFPSKRILWPQSSNNELADPETHTLNLDEWY